MKFIFFIAAMFVTAAVAQKPVFKKLLDPQMHAGCYIGQSEKIIANLSEGDSALFNLSGKDEFFKPIKKIAGYKEAYGNKMYKIYLNNKFVRKGDGCLEDHLYNIKVLYKGRSYTYNFKGFCGC